MSAAAQEITGNPVMQLRSIPPERAALSTRLLGCGEYLLHQDGEARLELRADVAQHVPHATTVELGHAHGRIRLVLTAEHGSAAIGDRTWHDFDGDARLLAWALAYERLLTQLADVLGSPLLPVELLPAPGAAADLWHWVGFEHAHGERASSSGLLGLDRAMMEALAAAPGWVREDSSATASRRDAVPLPCHVSLAPLWLPAAGLRGLEPGDVLLAGHRDAVLATLRLCACTGVPSIDHRHAWLAACGSEGLAITRPLTEAELRNDAMTEDTSIEPTPDEDSAPDETDVRDTIPVRVDVVLEALQLSLGELAGLGAGQVLSLAQPVDNATVSLRANGRVIGSGELVSLGELLGVKITRIGGDNGFQ